MNSPDAGVALPAPALVTSSPPSDALLAGLLLLARALGRPSTADALCAGLPLEARRMTPEMAPRALSRLGLSARWQSRPLDAISALVLPVLLLLKDGQTCVLVGRLADGRYEVVEPESGAGEAVLNAAALQAAYSGQALFARAEHRFDARHTDAAVPRAQHWFWDVIWQAWPIYAEVLVASLLINLFALVMPLFTMNVYDRVVPNRVMETLWVLAIGVLIVVLFDLVIRSLRSYFIDVAGKRIDLILSANIFERVLGIRMAARPPSVGAFASNLQEFESFREFLTSATITTLVDLPFVLLFVAALFWVGGPLGWVVVLAIPLVLAVSLALQGPIARTVQASYRYAAQRQATLVESLVGIETLKIIGAQGVVQRKWEDVVAQLGLLGLRSRLLSTLAVNVSSAVQQGANVAVVVVGVYLMDSEQLTVGALIAATLLCGRALAPMGQIVQLLTRYHQCRTSLANIDRLMQLPTERENSQNYLERPRLRGAIEFRDVSFRYPGSQVDTLSKLTFRIAPGERVAVIGRVGSGKSTLEKLILGLYQPDAGGILLDGAELRQLDPVAVRRDIGYLPQDVMLFAGTIRENITYGAPFADDAQVLRAARIAGVADFVDHLPEGYDRAVGERGEGLSGGQRQAVAIARALLTEPAALLLDEPSSAMDSQSENLLKARLEAALGTRTLLLITHRPSLLSLVNRLIVMDGGRIIADGPKDKVLAALEQGKVHGAPR